jgi:apolipoprotein N-acyltransferase
MNIAEEFVLVITTLQAAGIDFAVCGGVAKAVHGLPRFTRDINLLIQPSDLDAAIEALKACGYEFDSGNIPFATVNIRRITKIVGPDFLVLDLMIVNDWLAEIWNKRERIEWNGNSVPAVSAVGLARMKRLAGRLQDLADIERLGFEINDPAIQP